MVVYFSGSIPKCLQVSAIFSLVNHYNSARLCIYIYTFPDWGMVIYHIYIYISNFQDFSQLYFGFAQAVKDGLYDGKSFYRPGPK